MKIRGGIADPGRRGYFLPLIKGFKEALKKSGQWAIICLLGNRKSFYRSGLQAEYTIPMWRSASWRR